MKTEQECFDITCQHLMTQRVAALNDEANCVYRAANGMSCSVGKWIEDKNYTPAMEGKRIGALIKNFNQKLPDEVKVHHELFGQLQSAHDDSLKKSVKLCAEHLQDIAYLYKLTLPECVTKELEVA